MKGRVPVYLAALGVALLVAVGVARASGGLSWTDTGSRTGDSVPAGLACPSAAVCAIVTGDDPASAVAFNPAFAGTAPPLSLSTAADGLACPTSSECVVSDSNGTAQVFNPGSSVAPRNVSVGVAGAIRCPTATECVVAGTTPGGSAAEAAFDPRAPSTPPVVGTLAVTAVGVACPSTFQCTAVGVITGGGGAAAQTFNPQSGLSSPMLQSAVHTLTSIACPNAGQCTAAGRDGYIWTFTPTGATRQTGALAGGSDVNAISCPTSTFCVAVGNLGLVATGNPQSAPATWRTVSLTNDTFIAVACASTSACVAADRGGGVWRASGSAPARTTTTASSTTGAASVTRVAALDNGANVYARCAGPSTVRCRVSFSLAAGLSSGTAASKVVTLRAGVTRVTLALVPAAQRLLDQYGSLHGTLTVDQRVGSALKQVAQPSFTIKPTSEAGIVGAATVTRVSTLSDGANVYARCAGPRTVHCRVSFSLAAGLASGKAAFAVMTLSAGVTRVPLTLVPAAQQLLNRYGSLHGTLTVDQRIGSALKQVAQPSFTINRR